MIKKMLSFVSGDTIRNAVLFGVLFLALVPSFVTGIVAINALPQLPGMEDAFAGSFSALFTVLAATIAATIANIAGVELTEKVFKKKWETSKITPAASAFFNLITQTLTLLGLSQLGVVDIEGNKIANALLAGGILGIVQIPIFEATMALLGERSTDVALFFKGLVGQLLTCYQDWSALTALSLQFILPTIFANSEGFVFTGNKLTAFALGVSFTTFSTLAVIPVVIVPAILWNALFNKGKETNNQKAKSFKVKALSFGKQLLSVAAFTGISAAWLKLACTFYPDVLQVAGPVEFFTGVACLVAMANLTYPLRKHFSPCANGACSV
jgi:hypothetical protein